MKRTFKNIINDLEKYCDNHYQINDFGWGLPEDISTKNHDFVMVWLNPQDVEFDNTKVILNFEMLVFDLVKQDKTNLLDVLNDTLLIGNDIIVDFWDNESGNEWVVNENTTAEKIEAEFDDYCAGWLFNISVEVENIICETPDGI
jgi:hypothetical protein